MIGPNLSEIGVRHRSVTLFLLLAIALAGTIAFMKLGRAEDPVMTIRKMVVTVAWPGATAAEMESQVADKLEKRLQELDNLEYVETIARPGLAILTVTLTGSSPKQDVPEQWYQVRKKLSDEAPGLPRGVIGPFFNDEYSDVYFALFALEAPGMAERRLVSEAEALRTRLLHVPGVGEVNILGEQQQRIHVDFDPARLALLGLTPADILASLNGINAVAPGGFVETSGPRVEIMPQSGLDGIEAVRAAPVTAKGRTIALGDIAQVHYGYEDPPRYAIRHQGNQALMIGVVMRQHYDGSRLGEDLHEEIRRIRSELPLGIDFTLVSDQSRIIAEAYGEFILKFALAVAVIMIVTLLTLGIRVGLVVAASVPLTLGAVFVIMLLTGRGFDRITLGALVLSLGLLVDDAIIAIEMMVAKMEEGFDKVAAATFAWHSTAGPMLAGTLVTAVGFLPIGIAKSVPGEYAGNIFWITAIALIVSWFVAVFFAPYLGVQLLPDRLIQHQRPVGDFVTERRAQFRELIGWCIRHKRRVAFYTAASFILAVFALALIPKQFYPTSDRSELLVEVNLPHGSSMKATTATVAKIEQYLVRQPEAQMVDSYVGGGAPRFFLTLNPEMPNPAFAKIIVQTATPEMRIALRDRLRAHIGTGVYPEARVRVTELLFGPPVPFPIVFRVSGPDPDMVRSYAAEAEAIVAANPHVRDSHLNWGEKSPALRLAFDPQRLQALGLDAAMVSRQLAALVSGVTATQARIGERTVDVVVRARTGEGDLGLARIRELPIATSNGTVVTVGQLARLEPVSEDVWSVRRNRVPTIAVEADIVEGRQAPDVTAAIEPAMDALRDRLPPGYHIATGGSVEESGKGRQSLIDGAPIMLVLMLLIVMVQVRSFRLTALIFATAPLGLIGAVIALALTGLPFGFNAILGLIGLAGILMRNTLILVDQIALNSSEGATPFVAVTEATVRRARPVILASVATMLAFIPLTLSSFFGPLAVVLIGGLVTGTALTLLAVPALYAIWFSVDPEPATSSAK